MKVGGAALGGSVGVASSTSDFFFSAVFRELLLVGLSVRVGPDRGRTEEQHLGVTWLSTIKSAICTVHLGGHVLDLYQTLSPCIRPMLAGRYCLKPERSLAKINISARFGSFGRSCGDHHFSF